MKGKKLDKNVEKNEIIEKKKNKKQENIIDLNKINRKKNCSILGIISFLVFIILIISQISYNITLQKVSGYVIGFKDIQLYDKNNEYTGKVITYPTIEYKIAGRSFTDSIDLKDNTLRSGQEIEVNYVKKSKKHELRNKVDFSILIGAFFAIIVGVLIYIKSDIKKIFNKTELKNNKINLIVSLISFIVLISTIIVCNSFLSVDKVKILDGVSNNILIVCELIILAIINYCTWKFNKKKSL